MKDCSTRQCQTMQSIYLICIFATVAVQARDGAHRTSSFANLQSRNQQCHQLAVLLFRGMQYTLRGSPQMSVQYQKYLGISGRNLDEFKGLICPIMNATTLKEVADRIPASYDQVKESYNSLKMQMTSRGGYTGVWRFPSIRYDVGKWAKSKGFSAANYKISERVDLNTFTRFLESMQVKYGSRWVSALVSAENEDVLITDVGKFAKDLYESETTEQLCDRTGLVQERCYYMLYMFGTLTSNALRSARRLEQINFQMFELMGHYGLLDLH